MTSHASDITHLTMFCGGTCHGHVTGQKKFGSFPSIDLQMLATGFYALCTSEARSSIYLTALLSGSLGKVILRFVRFPLFIFSMTQFTQDIMKLIARLLSIARRRNHAVCVDMDLDGWVARPLMVSIVATSMVWDAVSSYMLSDRSSPDKWF